MDDRTVNQQPGFWRDMFWPTIFGFPGLIATWRLYGTFDSRKQTAIWVARWFKCLPAARPGISDDAIVRAALDARYLRSHNLHLYNAAMTFVERGAVRGARDLSHLIAELELLRHLSPLDREHLEMAGENIVLHTYRVMDEQLAALGL
jgi:hypothetical protein